MREVFTGALRPFSERFLLNGQAMNLGLLALATFGASWLYDRAGKNQVMAVLLFLGGLFWWFLLGGGGMAALGAAIWLRRGFSG